MILITNPDRTQWTELLKRPVMNTENLFDTVRGIIAVSYTHLEPTRRS